MPMLSTECIAEEQLFPCCSALSRRWRLRARRSCPNKQSDLLIAESLQSESLPVVNALAFFCPPARNSQHRPRRMSHLESIYHLFQESSHENSHVRTFRSSSVRPRSRLHGHVGILRWTR